jgi:hypothetical protein
MREKSDDSAPACLLALIASDINLALVYVSVARSAYKRGRFNEGEFSCLKAEQFYGEALHWVLQIREPERRPFLSELENLRTNIRWLSMQTSELSNLDARTHEDLPTDELLLRLSVEES